MLLLHISIALLGLAVTAWACIAPSRHKLHFSYGFVALTMASGTYLVISTGSPLLPACTSGLAYLAVAFAGIAFARVRLARNAS